MSYDIPEECVDCQHCGYAGHCHKHKEIDRRRSWPEDQREAYYRKIGCKRELTFMRLERVLGFGRANK